MSLGFFCLNITGMGALSSIKSLSVWLIIILFSSGIIGIGAGVVLYLVCIKRFGIVTTSMLNLSTPFFTVLFAFIVLNETINLKQFIFGIILLIGSVLIVKSTFKHKLPEKIPL
jgi:drug/metabolite transporter (DMT)-like permease